MTFVRRLLARRQFAMLLCVAALLLKLLIPSGYMIDNSHGRITVMICSGMTPRTISVEMPGMHGDMAHHGNPEEKGKPELPCAFAGMSAAALGSTDPILLVALIAFVMAIGLGGITVPRAVTPTWLRPPLRAPPATT